jgi:Spy/CpxP family protein refolding chaperone
MKASMWFSLGLVAGAVLMGVWLRFRFGHHPQPPNPDHLIQIFAKGLDLSESQYADLRKVIIKHDVRFKALHDEQDAKRQAFKNAVQSDIRELLDDKQRAKFDRLMAEQEARWKKGPGPRWDRRPRPH